MYNRESAARIFINGKFLTAPPTGVQRVARELVLALDDLISKEGPASTKRDWVLLSPKGADRLNLHAIAQQHTDMGGGALWEQCVLPFAARSGLLVNFCNVAPLFHKKNIITFHDAQIHQSKGSYSWAFRRWYKFLQPRIARNALELATVSDFSRQEIARHGVSDSSRIVVIPNGVDHILRRDPDLDILSRHGLAPRRYFLSFFSAQPHKNIPMLINAFRNANIEEYQLALIGGPSDVERSQEKNVTFLGGVNDSELRALYENASFFLFPSITEGFGLPPGEALACGCPSVTATGGALGEIYKDAAITLDPHDEAAWTGIVQTIAAQPELRDEWIERGRQLVRRLTWRAAAQAYFRLICGEE